MISVNLPLQNPGIALQTLMPGLITHMQQSWDRPLRCKAKVNRVGNFWDVLRIGIRMNFNLDDSGLLANLVPSYGPNLEQQFRGTG
jgi:hypothetical protein